MTSFSKLLAISYAVAEEPVVTVGIPGQTTLASRTNVVTLPGLADHVPLPEEDENAYDEDAYNYDEVSYQEPPPQHSDMLGGPSPEFEPLPEPVLFPELEYPELSEEEEESEEENKLQPPDLPLNQLPFLVIDEEETLNMNPNGAPRDDPEADPANTTQPKNVKSHCVTVSTSGMMAFVLAALGLRR